MDKISIIVPIYNVENYINKCVESIVNQTYKNIEVILVDDGSTDNSGKICDCLKEKHPLIKVIHKENGGLSSARNAGLDIAQGEYIGFVDSDDFIDFSMYEKLYDAIITCKCNLAICGVQMVSEYMEAIQTPEVIEKLVDKKFLFDKSLENVGWPYVTAWNRLYKKEVFENLRFKLGKYNEDMFLAPYLYERCGNAVIISDALYFYVQRKGSIMHSNLNVKVLNQVEAYYNAYKMLEDKGYDRNLVIKAAKQTCYVFGLRRWRIRIKNVEEKEYVKTIDLEFARTLRCVEKRRFVWRFYSKHPFLYSVIFMLMLKGETFVKKLFNE